MPSSTCSLSNQSAQPLNKRVAVYSFNWANAKVDQALKSHPRAWEIIKLWSGLCDRQLAFLLACNDPAWPALRSLAHQYDKWNAKQARCNPDAPLTTIQTLSILLRICGESLPDSLRGHLTARYQAIKLKKQVEEGEGPTGPSGLFAEAEVDQCRTASGSGEDITLNLESEED